MKLIFCTECSDVFRLVGEQWRMCMCGQSGGQYDQDNINATIGGSARVFGIANPFFFPEYLDITQEAHIPQRYGYTTDGIPLMTDMHTKLQEYREEQGYGSSKSDVWWGEYAGDDQITRISNPDGPSNFGQKVFTNKHKLWWILQILLGRVNFYSMKRSLKRFSSQLQQTTIENEMLRKEIREFRDSRGSRDSRDHSDRDDNVVTIKEA